MTQEIQEVEKPKQAPSIKFFLPDGIEELCRKVYDWGDRSQTAKKLFVQETLRRAKELGIDVTSYFPESQKL